MPQWLYLFRLKSAIWTGQNLLVNSNFHQKFSYKVLSPHWLYASFQVSKNSDAAIAGSVSTTEKKMSSNELYNFPEFIAMSHKKKHVKYIFHILKFPEISRGYFISPKNSLTNPNFPNFGKSGNIDCWWHISFLSWCEHHVLALANFEGNICTIVTTKQNQRHFH